MTKMAKLVNIKYDKIAKIGQNISKKNDQQFLDVKFFGNNNLVESERPIDAPMPCGGIFSSLYEWWAEHWQAFASPSNINQVLDFTTADVWQETYKVISRKRFYCRVRTWWNLITSHSHLESGAGRQTSHFLWVTWGPDNNNFLEICGGWCVQEMFRECNIDHEVFITGRLFQGVC